MLLRAAPMAAASSEQRQELVNSALRSQLMGDAVERGLSKQEAKDEVQQIMETVNRVTSGSLQRTVIVNESESSTPLTEELPNDLHTSTISTPGEKSPRGPFFEPKGSVIKLEISAHVEESLKRLSQTSSANLRKLVRKNTTSALDPPASKATEEKSMREIQELAVQLCQNDLSKETLERVRTLSTSQKKKLSRMLKNHSKDHITREVIEMLHYLIFIVLFVAVSMYGRNDDTPYRLTLSLMSQLQEKPWPARVIPVTKTFNECDSIEELHKFFLGGLYDVVYAGATFDGDTTFPDGLAYGSRGTVAGYGEIWGPVRIGQLRVKPSHCSGYLSDELFQNESAVCFPEYSSATESREPYGHGEHIFTADSTATTEPTFISRTGRFYPGPAFNIYLPNKESPTCNMKTYVGCPVYDQLKMIKEAKFFDRATRIVFIDMTVYNRNFRQLSLVRMYLEAFPSGGLAPVGEFQTYLLYSYTTFEDLIKMSVEILILLVATYHLYKEFKVHKSIKTMDYSARTHILTLIFFHLIGFFKIISYMSLPYVEEINETKFLNFRRSAQYFWAAEAIASIVCFLVWMKLFHFLAFIPKFAQLIKTITKASKELSGLLLIFLVALIGSSIAFQTAFGLRLYGYHSFWRSFLTLLQVIINKVDFENILETNQILGPIYFCLFVLLMLFVILNMCIVIITEAYVAAQEEIELLQEIELNLVTKEILEHVFHHVFFELPIFGKYFFQPISKYILNIKRKKMDKKIIINHENGVSAVEFQAVLRLKHGSHDKNQDEIKTTPENEINSETEVSIEKNTIKFMEEMETILNTLIGNINENTEIKLNEYEIYLDTWIKLIS